MTTGFATFDRTVQESNIWLKEIETRLGVPRHQAYAGLRATFHVLRDRLPPETALHLADQLPILLRGVFTEAWNLAGKPTGEHTATEFTDRIAAQLPPGFPADAFAVAQAVFQVIRDQVDSGEAEKILVHLPRPIRLLWLETA